MAKAVLVVERHATGHDFGPTFEFLNRALAPDNIAPRAPQLANRNGASAAIFSPNGAVQVRDASILLGTFVDDAPDWHQPGATPPDGSYALLRTSDAAIELVADPAASRTLWYVLTDERFIAATSQRAIAALLGSFEPNRQAVSWMLSSGTLGPIGGWDQRVERVRPGEIVHLDRTRWKLTRQFEPAVFATDERSTDQQHLERMRDTIQTVCTHWQIDARRWLLPLSGGVDSRGLLFMLRNREHLETVTWGTAAAREKPGNDAKVAQALAAAAGVPNRYYVTDLSAEPRERLIERFLTAGEGRVARISGYTDGFKIWKTLYDEGVDGVIRGDEALGSVRVRNVYNARFRGGLTLMSDYFQPAEIETFELPEQYVHEHLLWQPNETLATWRDRTYMEFRVPTMLAALTDLKTPYVEVANPLLTGAVLQCVRSLPDRLRTDKRLWRKLVVSQFPRIPFATGSAVIQLTHFLNDSDVMQLMLAEMKSPSALDTLAPALRSRISASIVNAMRKDGGKRRLRSVLPQQWRTNVRKWVGVKPQMSPLLLGFRAFIASRMNAILKHDASSLHAALTRAAGF